MTAVSDVGPTKGPKSCLTDRIRIDHVACSPPLSSPKGLVPGPPLGHCTRGFGALDAAPPESVETVTRL